MRKAAGESIRKTDAIAIRCTSRSHAEKLIDGYLTKHPSSHFASEIAEALGLEFRTTLEVIKRMIDSSKIHRAGSEHVR
ncbi:MAG: hypothetical protein ABSD99_08585 [Candidatus Bathyarchaeia archaeon]